MVKVNRMNVVEPEYIKFYTFLCTAYLKTQAEQKLMQTLAFEILFVGNLKYC